MCAHQQSSARRGSTQGRLSSALTKRTGSRAKLLAAFKRCLLGAHAEGRSCDSVSVKQLTKLAAVSRATFYQHFDGVPAVALEMAEDARVHGQNLSPDVLAMAERERHRLRISHDPEDRLYAELNALPWSAGPEVQTEAARLREECETAGVRPALLAYAYYVAGRVIPTDDQAAAAESLRWYLAALETAQKDAKIASRSMLVDYGTACAQMLLYPGPHAVSRDALLAAHQYLAQANHVREGVPEMVSYLVHDLITDQMLQRRLGLTTSSPDTVLVNALQCLDQAAGSVADLEDAALVVAECAYVIDALNLDTIDVPQILDHLQAAVPSVGADLEVIRSALVLTRHSPDGLQKVAPENTLAHVALLQSTPESLPAAMALARLGVRYRWPTEEEIDGVSMALALDSDQRLELEMKLLVAQPPTLDAEETIRVLEQLATDLMNHPSLNRRQQDRVLAAAAVLTAVGEPSQL